MVAGTSLENHIMKKTPKLADEECLVYSIPQAGRMLGLSRNGAYAAAKAGTIPVIRFGKLLKVPAARLHRMIEE